MPTLNADCHIILTHANVNGGVGFGFILDGESTLGPSVTVQREVATDGSRTARLFFSVLLSNTLQNPDGSEHIYNRSEIHTMLQAYMEQRSGLQLECAIGLFTSLGALGHIATEQHFGEVSVIAMQVNNVGAFWPAADATRYLNSVWQPDDYTGPMNWDNSYWSS